MVSAAEVHLDERESLPHTMCEIQGYLAHKKHPPP